MVKKIKGRIFHIPLPLNETLKKLPKPEDQININHELYLYCSTRYTNKSKNNMGRPCRQEISFKYFDTFKGSKYTLF